MATGGEKQSTFHTACAQRAHSARCAPIDLGCLILGARILAQKDARHTNGLSVVPTTRAAPHETSSNRCGSSTTILLTIKIRQNHGQMGSTCLDKVVLGCNLYDDQ